MVDPALVTAAKSAAEGVTGFSLIPYLPGLESARHGQVGSGVEEGISQCPGRTPEQLRSFAYGDMYVLAEGMKRAGPSLTADSLIRALEGVQNYRVGSVATPRTFSTKHHIGNLALVPMVVKDGQWERCSGRARARATSSSGTN